MNTRKPVSKKTAAKKPATPAKYQVEIGIKVTGTGPLVPGDVVRLRSDRTVQMTIESISKGEACCTWFLENLGYLETKMIALAALVRVS